MNFNSNDTQTILPDQVRAAIEEKFKEISTNLIKDILKSMIEIKKSNEKILNEIKENREDLSTTENILNQQEIDLNEREKVLNNKAKELDDLERSLKFRESNLSMRENAGSLNSHNNMEYPIANAVLSTGEPIKLDFTKMKISQLISYCRENNIQGYSKCNKAELIDLIENSILISKVP